MSNTIKVPYEYESAYFGTVVRVRWLSVIVSAYTTTRHNFIPTMTPHSVSRNDFIMLECKCAKKWLKGYRGAPVTAKEAMGILTILDWGLPELVAEYGGDKQSMLDSINTNSNLDETSSFIFVTALTNALRYE